MAGVKRGRGRGNLGARERVGRDHLSQKGLINSLFFVTKNNLRGIT